MNFMYILFRFLLRLRCLLQQISCSAGMGQGGRTLCPNLQRKTISFSVKNIKILKTISHLYGIVNSCHKSKIYFKIPVAINSNSRYNRCRKPEDKISLFLNGFSDWKMDEYDTDEENDVLQNVRKAYENCEMG